ncbi:phage protease [Dactylosporangium sp. CA-139066]|uniref:phage protease n=1 Tax=Dactylosporangium sp. CA-139066 TaxID=3239930 RepID=UPI003D8CA9DD
MADIVVPQPPALVRIPRVELIHTGQWPISTGVWTATREDLQAAVAALDCPAVHRPGIKIGHTDGRFTDPIGDGEPLLGYVDNLAGEDDWNILVGDFAGVPAWLGAVDDDGNSVISSAYPHRSIEGVHDFRCQIGHTHPFVLTAVALLGATHPGVGTLQSLPDLMALYGVHATTGTGGTPVRAAVDDPAKTKAMVALVPSEADARRLAVDDGLPAAELHLTLLFLGDAAEWDEPARAALRDAAQTLHGDGVVEGDGFALSVFNPGSDDKDTCIVLGVGGEQVAAFHTKVTETLPADGVPAQHEPWVAHISLVYSDDLAKVAALVDRTGPVTFDRLRVAFAGDITDIPLTATTQAAAGPGERSPMPNPSPTKVAAGVTTEDVRRAYYDNAPSWDYWITEFHLDPLQLIVCDDRDGKYYRIPVSITGEDTFEFGNPTEVLIRYVDAGNDQTVAAAAADKRLVYASRAESRPGSRPQANTAPDGGQPVEVQPTPADGEPVVTEAPTTPAGPPTEAPAAEPDVTTDQEDNMSLSAIRARLGLADDADEAAVLAALDAKLPGETGDGATQPDTPAAAPEPVAASPAKPALPDGVVTIDAATLAELRRGAQLGIQAAERQRVAERDAAIAAARDDGRISPARVEHWTRAWEADPDGTRETLASLEPGLMVPTVMAGETGTGEEHADPLGVSESEAGDWARMLGIDAKELSRG